MTPARVVVTLASIGPMVFSAQLLSSGHPVLAGLGMAGSTYVIGTAVVLLALGLRRRRPSGGDEGGA
ncbi:MAG: hypothetical protein M3P48_11830 [Actinomycetota bacterium]|nr:hypothetical protein [Actinomycetota bacterium]